TADGGVLAREPAARGRRGQPSEAGGVQLRRGGPPARLVGRSGADRAADERARRTPAPLPAPDAAGGTTGGVASRARNRRSYNRMRCPCTRGGLMPTKLQPGEPAPAFELKDQHGNVHKLSDYRGKSVVLYFYPKDETRGCTMEACQFRDEHSALQAMGAVVLGVSRDDEESHRAFAEHWELPFPLLVDQDHSVAEAYGAWGE